MDVRIPTPLRSYTGGAKVVEATGGTVWEVMEDLEARYPGLRFRMVDEQGQLRQHMILWIAGERCRDMHASLDGVDELVIMQALSGGCAG
jgi:molybdopterin synthase sulfur carrier subunit